MREGWRRAVNRVCLSWSTRAITKTFDSMELLVIIQLIGRQEGLLLENGKTGGGVRV